LLYCSIAKSKEPIHFVASWTIVDFQHASSALSPSKRSSSTPLVARSLYRSILVSLSCGGPLFIRPNNLHKWSLCVARPNRRCRFVVRITHRQSPLLCNNLRSDSLCRSSPAVAVASLSVAHIENHHLAPSLIASSKCRCRSLVLIASAPLVIVPTQLPHPQGASRLGR